VFWPNVRQAERPPYNLRWPASSSDTVGGLLNVTFGNAPELIIAVSTRRISRPKLRGLTSA
jgi:hypothetical protein